MNMYQFGFIKLIFYLDHFKFNVSYQKIMILNFLYFFLKIQFNYLIINSHHFII